MLIIRVFCSYISYKSKFYYLKGVLLSKKPLYFIVILLRFIFLIFYVFCWTLFLILLSLHFVFIFTLLLLLKLSVTSFITLYCHPSVLEGIINIQFLPDLFHPLVVM